MKRAVVFFALAMMILASCSVKQKLVGTWIDNDGGLWMFTSAGQVIYNGYDRAMYSITGTQLSLSISDDNNLVLDYSISSDGKTLFLSESNSQDSRVLTKRPPPTNLFEKKWVNASITPNNRVIVYSFYGLAEKTYYIWTNDKAEGDSSKSLDITLSVFDENVGYNDADDCWNTPCKFAVSKNGRVTITVRAYDETETGTFAISYSTNPVRP